MVETVTLEQAGVKVVLISTGAAILSIHTPDRNGEVDDIVLGHPTVEDYAVRTWASIRNRLGRQTFTPHHDG